MSDYRFMVRQRSDGEELFFAKMGRFFADTGIRKELGGSPLSDLPHSQWLTFSDEAGRVIAFLLVEVTGKHMGIKDGYVDPEHRGKKLLSQLIAHACDLAHSNECGIVARVRKGAQKHFAASQFEKTSEAGDWVSLEKSYAPGRKQT